MKTRKFSPQLDAKELKVGKLEIDSLYVCEKIPCDIEAIMKVEYRVRKARKDSKGNNQQ